MKVNYFGVEHNIGINDYDEIGIVNNTIIIDIDIWMKILINRLGDIFIPEPGIYTRGSVDPLPEGSRVRLQTQKHTWVSDCVGYTVAAVVRDYFEGIMHRLPRDRPLHILRFLPKTTNTEMLFVYMSKLIDDVDHRLGPYSNNLMDFGYRNNKIIIEIGYDWRTAEFLRDAISKAMDHDSKLEAGLIDPWDDPK